MRKYFEKDTICKNCSHERYHHTMFQYINEGNNLSRYIYVYEYVPCMSFPLAGIGLCNCKDFQSRDNLEYLEKKYEENNKK